MISIIAAPIFNPISNVLRVTQIHASIWYQLFSQLKENWVSFLYIYLSSLTNTTCWTCCVSFSKVYAWILCWVSGNWKSVIPKFYSIEQQVCFHDNTMPVLVLQLCSITWWCLGWIVITLSILCLLRIVLAMVDLLYFYMKFNIDLLKFLCIFMDIDINISMYWIWLDGHFHNINSPNPLIEEIFLSHGVIFSLNSFRYLYRFISRIFEVRLL